MLAPGGVYAPGVRKWGLLKVYTFRRTLAVYNRIAPPDPARRLAECRVERSGVCRDTFGGCSSRVLGKVAARRKSKSPPLSGVYTPRPLTRRAAFVDLGPNI